MNVIAYHPPKSASHGHGPRARSTRKAWSAIQEFLAAHTISELRSPLKLMSWGVSQWTDSAVVEAVRTEATELFGVPTSSSGEFFNWELPIERLVEALEFSFADDARPKQALGPVGLYVSYSFRWKNLPNPPAPTEHFGRGNWLGVFLGGRRVFIQPTFLFESSGRDFITQLKQLERAMPFAPKDDYYYRIEPKKTKAGEKLVKLHRGWKMSASLLYATLRPNPSFHRTCRCKPRQSGEFKRSERPVFKIAYDGFGLSTHSSNEKAAIRPALILTGGYPAHCGPPRSNP